MTNDLRLGIDLGITSIGLALIENDNLIYSGVRMFNVAHEASDLRRNRSARRNLKRKSWRKKQLRKAFSDFGLISAEDFDIRDYNCFTARSDAFTTPEDKTVYHLRKRALCEKVSLREIYLSILNILHARGHFNMEMIDFTKESVSLDGYIDKFYSITNSYFEISEMRQKEFNDKFLKEAYNGKANNALVNQIKKEGYVKDNDDAFIEILKLLCGYKADLGKIDSSIEIKQKKSIQDIKKDDILSADLFLSECIDLFDMAKLSQILKEYNYLCEKAVHEIDEYESIITEYGKDSAEYKEKVKSLEGITKGKHNRSWRNLDNNYPNGLYLKEVEAILEKQKEYYPDLITEEFIDICKSIVSARIPYFIGPLSNSGRNAWLTKNDEYPMKYSFAYTQKKTEGKAVDEYASINAWKDRMISRCTYLPEEPALPKGSLLGEFFSIMNELNILTAIDKDLNDYYLTYEDKVKVFDQLFLKNKTVKYNDVADVLGLSSFGPKNTGKKDPVFNNVFTLYHDIVEVDPSLKLTTIMDIFDDVEKMEKIEEIILALNLYDEERSKYDYFRSRMEYDDSSARRLSRLKSTSFYSFSRKFILVQPIDRNGQTLLSRLMSDNTKEYTNEQMTLITNATDVDGNKIDFVSNKYVEKIRKNAGKMDINLLMNEGKPIIPVSRPVVRALNECMKVYSELVKVYGVPARVIIETARDFKDHNITTYATESFEKSTENLYKLLIDQTAEKKITCHVEDWKTIEQYLANNKLKIELYIRQNGVDLLTGEPINLNQLSDYEVDHILPRGFGDDSKDDKMLISRLSNAKKGDRLPLQFLESGEVIGTLKTSSSDFKNRVKNLYGMKLISDRKYRLLMMETDLELDGFINQNLSDTRYIIREFMSILKAYNQVHEYETKIVALKSKYTGLYRKAFYMNKNRDYGDQHHAHDAALVVIADKTLSHYYPNYDRQKPKKADRDNSMKTYKGFINKINLASGKGEEAQEKRNELTDFIRKAYNNTFSLSYSNPNSLISQIKQTVPFYSCKVEKNYTGQFFELNPMSQKEYEKKKGNNDPLTVIGVNNSNHAFSGVNCVAVDFYKFTNKKGKKEHLAVQIPKVIVSNDGVIDKEKYKNLIINYYKRPELIDENGNIKEYYYRFRAFYNDIIYDSAGNCPTLFRTGSISKKILEIDFINVFSYNEIYKHSKDFQDKIIKKFDLNTGKNILNIEYNNDIKIKYADYVINKLWHCSVEGIIKKSLLKKAQSSKNLYELCDLLSFNELIYSRPEYPDSDNRCRPSVNNKYIKQNPDAEYIKLKYNILGLRFETNENDKLIISSPSKIQGAYTKVRKEKFSWNISGIGL